MSGHGVLWRHKRYSLRPTVTKRVRRIPRFSAGDTHIVWWIMMKLPMHVGKYWPSCGARNLTGSCQVTELWRHKRYKVRPFLREVAEYCTLTLFLAGGGCLRSPQWGFLVISPKRFELRSSNFLTFPKRLLRNISEKFELIWPQIRSPGQPKLRSWKKFVPSPQ